MAASGDRPLIWNISTGDISACHPIHSMFGFMVGFSGSKDQMVLLPVSAKSKMAPYGGHLFNVTCWPLRCFYFSKLLMLFFGPNTTRKHHKTFTCYFLVVDPFISYFDPPNLMFVTLTTEKLNYRKSGQFSPLY